MASQWKRIGIPTLSHAPAKLNNRSISAVLHSSQVGHDLTYVDAADFAAKQTFEPQLASLTGGVIATRGSDPDQRGS